MATTTNLLSWGAFERLPDDGMHHEIIQGELVSLPPPKLGHSEIAHRIFRALDQSAKPALVVYVEAGYKLTESPATWIQPDVSVVSEHRVQATSLDGYLIGAPELAIEIISPSESAESMGLKVELLLEHRSRVVWVVYLRQNKDEG